MPRNKFADSKQTHFFKPPHITCSFEADVKNTKQYTTPVGKLLFDRITITKQQKEGEKYVIHKHIYFG